MKVLLVDDSDLSRKVQLRVLRELQIGDVFCRLPYAGATPKMESIYTVHGLQFVPIRDFFGAVNDTVHVSADNRLLGRQNVALGADEPIYLMSPSDPHFVSPALEPSPRERSRGFGRRTAARFRWRG